MPTSPAGAGARAGPPPGAWRLLLWGRAALIAGEAALLALAELWLGAHLPWAALAALLGLHLALLAVGLGLRRHPPTLTDTALQLALDAALIGALVYFTGGYANPFISLLLLPLVLGAVLLPSRLSWALALWVAVLYTLLMRHYRPLGLELSDAAAVDLHLEGMWLNFLFTAALVAAFAGALANALRQREQELAHARERRLRDEQLFALGLQAAGAAHELATPLASARLTLDELRADYHGDEELSPALELMHAQLARAEAVLDRLRTAARTRGRSAGPALPSQRWIARVVERWGLLHPQARVALDLPDGLPPIEDDPMLEAVLTTLLDNAQEASPGRVQVSARVDGAALCLEVADAGPGLGGKSAGWGVGLELASAALERIGGQLHLAARPGGGTLARARIPLVEGV
ncbi:MAG: HAMP domain-containing histidine kinase [Thiobacillaceae bacterium]|nr:HAMP domain-containing histidine kinase [Thiobacillaceae bacterium]